MTDKVAIARAASDALSRGDPVGALELIDPDVEWHGTVGGLDEGRLYRGRDEVVAQFVAYFEEWEQLEIRAERFLDAGGDDVVGLFHEVARGRESGIVLKTDTATIQTIRGGRIVRVRPFMDRAEALRVAGLPPDAAAAPSNADLVRRALAELGGDLTASDLWHPQVEMVNAAGWVIETAYHGREGVMRWWDDLADAIDDLRFDLKTVRELDGERVLTTQRTTGTFRSTGIAMDAEWASIVTVRDGAVIYAEGFLTERRALRAAGLERG
jgi:ketosteroid isomerase-like protein